MKVHHGADVYLSPTGGIGKEPMEKECFKRGSKRSAWECQKSQEECVRCLPAAAEDRKWPRSQSYFFPAARGPECGPHLSHGLPAPVRRCCTHRHCFSFRLWLGPTSLFSPSLSSWVASDKFLNLCDPHYAHLMIIPTSQNCYEG